MKQLPPILLALIFLLSTGCMTIASKTASKIESGQFFGCPYSGVKACGMVMYYAQDDPASTAIFVPLTVADLFLSAPLDTLFYPVDKIYEWDRFKTPEHE